MLLYHVYAAHQLLENLPHRHHRFLSASTPTLAELGITQEISSQAPGKPYLATAVTATVTERQIIVERLNWLLRLKQFSCFAHQI